MKPINMNGLEVVKLDYDSRELPVAVQAFKPAVYKDGTDYYCLFGADPESGIFGCGATPKEAIADWEEHFKMALSGEPDKDGIVRYIKERLNQAKEEGCDLIL